MAPARTRITGPSYADPSADLASRLLAAGQAPSPPRDSVRRRLLALADILTLVAAYALTAAVAAPGLGSGETWLLALIPAWVVLNKLLGLYDRDANLIHKSSLNEVPRIAQSLGLAIAGLFVVSPLLPDAPVGRSEAIAFAAAVLVLTPSLRSVARGIARRAFPPERCMLVGSGMVAGLLARKIAGHPEHGVELVGYVDVQTLHLDESRSEIPRLGDVELFHEICESHAVERVVIAFSSLSHEHLLDIIRAAKVLNLKITVVPRLFEVIGHQVEIDQVEGMTLLGLRGLARTRSSLLMKRAIDIVFSAVGLLLASPLLVGIAAAIRIDMGGPVFFGQWRMGRGNELFRIWKFRTMVDGADHMKPDLLHLNEAHEPMFKIADDPRVTRVGRFLRRTSLDELPQLWNVLRGDMSLVGPRPLVASEDDHVIGWHRSRLDLTPGLTGPWQVMGRTRIPFQEMVKLDYLYVADWSLWQDMKLLLRTAAVVVRRAGH